MIPVARPILGAEEQAAVAEVIASGQIAHGPKVEEFERRFAELVQVGDAIAVTSGTAALHLALLAHGIGPGDEVITSPFSFAATANTIVLTGARPVFVDIDPQTYNIDPAGIEAAITPRTKALMPVHIYGNPADMDAIMPLAHEHGLTVIEDAAQAILATVHGKPAGSFGTGCFSLYATKNMTTGEGGMVTTSDPALADRLRQWRSHGQKQRYVQTSIGYNYRMMSIQAAIGLVQVGKVASWTEQRIANAAYLTSELREVVQTPTVLPGHRHVYHQYAILVPEGLERAAMNAARSRPSGTRMAYW